MSNWDEPYTVEEHLFYFQLLSIFLSLSFFSSRSIFLLFSHVEDDWTTILNALLFNCSSLLARRNNDWSRIVDRNMAGDYSDLNFHRLILFHPFWRRCLTKPGDDQPWLESFERNSDPTAYRTNDYGQLSVTIRKIMIDRGNVRWC